MNNADEEKKLIEELKKSVYGWYDPAMGPDVLVLENGPDELDEIDKEKKYDRIVSLCAHEKCTDPLAFLNRIKEHLNPGGTLLLCANNRLGIRYFCGDRDRYTDRVLDGLDDYSRAYGKKEDKFTGRMYDRHQLTDLLKTAGFSSLQFFSVFPTVEAATHIFRDDFYPTESLSGRLLPFYDYPNTIFLEENRIWQGLIENKMFHKMANGFLVECKMQEERKMSDVLSVTSSVERGEEDALFTIVHANPAGKPESVEKRAVYDKGRKRLEELNENETALRKKGVFTIQGELKGNSYTMPYVEALPGNKYLEDLLLSGDTDGFLSALDAFVEQIRMASETFEGTFVPDLDIFSFDRKKAEKQQKEDTVQTTLLKQAYIDMIPLNSFYEDGRFRFYDQEFMRKNYPAKAVIYRAIVSLYSGNFRLHPILPVESLYKRYGVDEDLEKWQRIDNLFLRKLRNEETLRNFKKAGKPDNNVIHSNRQRMNFSADDYQRLFIDIFDMTEGRKVVLFGSGKFAEQFLALYGHDVDIAFIADNNQSRIGTELNGIPIKSPEELKTMSHGEFKVIVCIKNYLSVMEQLEGMGIKEYSIYDAGRAYQRKRHPIFDPLQSDSVIKDREQAGKKKYHIGYISGVFDLYHVGHLNMFKNAKELCDYLIVGVVSDAGVKKFKKTETFVPFEERIEMVRSCRYVDEAQEIPLMFNNTEQAWNLYHFDVQFSGSDYVDNPYWLREKEFLEKHGATMHFFPYTQSTSSTQLKGLIEKKLI